jgi:homoserine dehydrogenase
VAGDRLRRIQGILNGTCNYILTRMECTNLSFEDALSEARRLGYAEADPSADVDGYDAQAKLAILVGVGLGRVVDVDDIPVHPITPVAAIDFAYARRLGCAIRQVARAELVPDTGGLHATVQPALVSEASALGRVGGSRNIVVVDGDFGGETAFSGFGAGGDPTAVAVVSDLMAIARRSAPGPDGWLPASDGPSPVVRAFEAPHYVRFMIDDRPGIVASLARVFSHHGINLDAVLQEPGWPKNELPFVMTLEACSSTSVAAALADAERFDFHVRPPLWLPMFVDRSDGSEGSPPA